MRYRKLIASRDAEAVQRIIDETRTPHDPGGDPLVAELTASKKVGAVEREARLDEIKQLVLAGELNERDLVSADDDLGWRPLGEHPQTMDFFAPEPPVASPGQWIAIAVVALVVMAVAIAVIG